MVPFDDVLNSIRYLSFTPQIPAQPYRPQASPIFIHISGAKVIHFSDIRKFCEHFVVLFSTLRRAGRRK